MTIEIDTENKVIQLGMYKLENWGHAVWLVNFITQNAEMLWGKEEKDGQEKAVAEDLSLVNKE